ncbi:MAG: KpsF/GutQ family sugar-phosphate isomerase [Mariniblastus sp.]|nr:KpsF/GutQ family sugar-phosphate isomerase [Mariniblastus sp.]
MEAIRKNSHSLPFDVMRQARKIVQDEARALENLAANLPVSFVNAVELIGECQGAVIVCGVGKAGWIGQKISASLASTGTVSHFLNPSEAFHGDLGRIGANDVVLALSNSGETSELTQILPRIDQFGVPIISITARADSTLANYSQVVLDYGKTPETGHLQLAPSTSTTVMLAIGDALALVVSAQLEFQAMDFAKYHPGGSLGRRLSLVEEIMRPIEHCRVADEQETVREIYVRYQGKDRRVGVVLVVDREGHLTGLFTDSDLARMLERQQDRFFDAPIHEVMTRNPFTVTTGSRTSVAVETLACRNLSELPVVDANDRPVGMIDITDVVGLLPNS